MKQILIAVGLSCALVACASSKKEVQDLRQENTELRKQQVAMQERVTSLSSSLSVLQDRMETMKLAMDKQMRRPGPVPAAPESSKVMRQSLPRNDGREPFLFEESASVQKLPALRLTNQDLDRADLSIQSPEPTGLTLQAMDDSKATEAYNRAYALYAEKKYSEAFQAFNQFVTDFRDHSYADNAIFWIGEGYYEQRQYDRAVEQFERVVRLYPHGNKVPDALLRAGSCHLRLSKPEQAQQAFLRLIESYPQSVAATKAKTWLAEINRNPSKGRM